MMVDTPWGYAVQDLPSLISVEEFRAMNPGFSSTDERLQMVLDAVSSAVRNYCGWHVAPNLECTYTGEGDGRMLYLPAMFVSNVESLTVENVPVSDYQWSVSGVLRLSNGCFPDMWRSVQCVYDAGLDVASIGAVVSQIASNALAAAPGVSAESAGNVSITYNKTGDGITGGVSMLARDYALVAPFKLVRAW